MWLGGSSGRCFGLQPHIVSTGHGVHQAESWMILSEITIFDQLQTLPVLFIRDGGHMQVTSHMRCHTISNGYLPACMSAHSQHLHSVSIQ